MLKYPSKLNLKAQGAGCFAHRTTQYHSPTSTRNTHRRLPEGERLSSLIEDLLNYKVFSFVLK